MTFVSATFSYQATNIARQMYSILKLKAANLCYVYVNFTNFYKLIGTCVNIINGNQLRSSGSLCDGEYIEYLGYCHQNFRNFSLSM